jgi:hypothetical protein
MWLAVGGAPVGESYEVNSSRTSAYEEVEKHMRRRNFGKDIHIGANVDRDVLSEGVSGISYSEFLPFLISRFLNGLSD